MTPLRTERRRARRAGGWTLLELLVSVAVFATAMGAIVGLLRSSATLTNVLSKQGEIQERGRRVVDSLVRELRWADTSTIVISTLNGSNKISLRTATGYAAGAVNWSPTITYQVNPSNVDSNHDRVLNEGCLVRIQNGRTTVLCNDVPAGGFAAVLSTNNVQLNLRLSATDMDRRAVTTTAEAAVTLRNKS